MKESGDPMIGDRVIWRRISNPAIVRPITGSQIVRLLLTALLSLSTLAATRSEIRFPRDHGSHPQAAVEWWYYTGHLRDGAGREYGYQLTFFRVGQLHLAHFGFSDAGRKRFSWEEKTHLELPGVAGAAQGHLQAFNEDWSASERDGTHLVRVSGAGVELELSLRPSKPPVLHGEGGLSRKGAGEREYSRYVSITRLATKGTLLREGRREALSGSSWFDHEWGPGVLPSEAAGWDWFALQLDDGSELMLYRMRRKDGSATRFSAGTYVPRRADPRPIAWREVRLQATGSWTSPRSRARYPSGWKISVGALRLELALEPLLADQELVTAASTGVTYWEGACRITGTKEGRPVQGKAYVELTGYAGRDVPGFAGGPGSRRLSAPAVALPPGAESAHPFRAQGSPSSAAPSRTGPASRG
jgi:predicted secreted hydrolase